MIFISVYDKNVLFNDILHSLSLVYKINNLLKYAKFDTFNAMLPFPFPLKDISRLSQIPKNQKDASERNLASGTPIEIYSSDPPFTDISHIGHN